jgi:hypothetical protein
MTNQLNNVYQDKSVTQAALTLNSAILLKHSKTTEVVDTLKEKPRESHTDGSLGISEALASKFRSALVGAKLMGREKKRLMVSSQLLQSNAHRTD